MNWISFRPFIVATVAFLLLISLELLFRGIHGSLSGTADFSQLYTTGLMVRSGDASSIYDFAVEQRIYGSVIPSAGIALPFDHPAYETLIFAPLSLLNYQHAYILFLFVNLALLSFSIAILWPRLSGLTGIWKYMPAAVFVCFAPVAIALVQGQDSLLLLSLVAAAAVSMDRGHEAIAGAFVGAALFKFQFAIPIAVLFFLWHRWKFVAGFALSASLAGLTSVLVVGWHAIVALFHLLVFLSLGMSTVADRAKVGVHPWAMANVRGLCYVLFSSSHWGTQIATIVISLAVLIYVARKKPSIDLAILAAALLSYHGLIHDMSLLAIPAAMMFLSGYASGDRWKICLPSVLLIAPTLLTTGSERFFLLSIPMIAALILGFDEPPARLTCSTA